MAKPEKVSTREKYEITSKSASMDRLQIAVALLANSPPPDGVEATIKLAFDVAELILKEEARRVGVEQKKRAKENEKMLAKFKAQKLADRKPVDKALLEIDSISES